MDETDPDLHIDVPGGARAEDEPDTEGYDDSQRDEIAEIEGGGPSDGTLITDLDADFGDKDIDDEDIENDADDLDAVIDSDDRK